MSVVETDKQELVAFPFSFAFFRFSFSFSFSHLVRVSNFALRFFLFFAILAFSAVPLGANANASILFIII